MDKLVVRAELRTPILGNVPTLDGLLAAVLFTQTGSLEMAHGSIPLRQTNGLWHASSGFLETGRPYRVVLTAALHANHDLTPDLIARSRGGKLPRMSELRKREFGNVQNPIQGRVAVAVWWFAEGDPDAVTELLRSVQYVGKKHTAGYGEISHLDVEPSGRTDGVLDPGNQPLRPIPVDRYSGDKSAVQAEAAWRPAYWKIENREHCFVPETILRTRDELEAML